MRLLAYALDYWSKGQLKALFSEHEVSRLISCDNITYKGHTAHTALQFEGEMKWAAGLLNIFEIV